MQIKTWSLLVFLGLAGSFSAAESTIAPLAAQAYTSRVNITLERQPNESFPTLTRRAETVARAAAQRSFDNDILVTQAAVVVTAENGGLSAPILSLEVSRDNWKNYPNAQRWSTYYPTSQALLRIENPVPTAAVTQPGQSPTNPTNSSGTGTTPTTGTTPANRSNQNSGTKPTATTGTGTTNRTGTANQRSNSTNTTGNTQNTQRSNSTNTTGNTQNTQRSNSSTTGNNTQQRNSTTPANTTGTNNNQTGNLSSPDVQQTNTQADPSGSKPTYGQGLIRRTRELRDDINNRPPTDLPE